MVQRVHTGSDHVIVQTVQFLINLPISYFLLTFWNFVENFFFCSIGKKYMGRGLAYPFPMSPTLTRIFFLALVIFNCYFTYFPVDKFSIQQYIKYICNKVITKHLLKKFCMQYYFGSFKQSIPDMILYRKIEKK